MEHGQALGCMEHGPALGCMEHGQALGCMEHGQALGCMEHGQALGCMEQLQTCLRYIYLRWFRSKDKTFFLSFFWTFIANEAFSNKLQRQPSVKLSKIFHNNLKN